MTRRRRKTRGDLFEGLLGMGLIAVFLLSYQITDSFKVSGVITGMVLGLVIGLLIVRKLNYIERLKKSGISDIDKMEGRQFEHYLGHLFKSHGYDVKVTQAAGDYGADLVIAKGGKKIVVQAKRYSKAVGIKAVQEAQASIAHYGASEAWVVTNSGFTDAAIELAKSNNVKLIDREQLVELVLKLNPAANAPTPKQVIAAMPQEENECPRCGGQMVRRKGARGEFMGCSNFPKCRNTKVV